MKRVVNAGKELIVNLNLVTEVLQSCWTLEWSKSLRQGWVHGTGYRVQDWAAPRAGWGPGPD